MPLHDLGYRAWQGRLGTRAAAMVGDRADRLARWPGRAAGSAA